MFGKKYGLKFYQNEKSGISVKIKLPGTAEESEMYKILIVDDGSKDGSLSICKEYASIDKRVRVYHKENSGVSDTRNFGIEHANGEFISFLRLQMIKLIQSCIGCYTMQ